MSRKAKAIIISAVMGGIVLIVVAYLRIDGSRNPSSAATTITQPTQDDASPQGPAAPATLPASAMLSASQFTTVSLGDYLDATVALQPQPEAQYQYHCRLIGKEIVGAGIVKRVRIITGGLLLITIIQKADSSFDDTFLVSFTKDAPECKMAIREGDSIQFTGRFDDEFGAKTGQASGTSLRILAPATQP